MPNINVKEDYVHLRLTNSIYSNDFTETLYIFLKTLRFAELLIFLSNLLKRIFLFDALY